jgi:tellurite resistance protein TehA-like permease
MVTIFFPAISISASILSTAISNVIFPLRLFYFDQHLGFLLAFIFYGLGMVGGIVFLLMTSYIFAISQTIEITQTNGAWLLPPVRLFMNIFAGNFLIAQFQNPIGYYLLIFHIFCLGVAFFSYFLMLSLVFHQLYCCPPPHLEMAPSFAVSLAPPGVSVIALLSLEKALGHFPQLYSLQSDFLPFISIYVFFVIGYGCFWAILAALIMVYYLKTLYARVLGFCLSCCSFWHCHIFNCAKTNVFFPLLDCSFFMGHLTFAMGFDRLQNSIPLLKKVRLITLCNDT